MSDWLDTAKKEAATPNEVGFLIKVLRAIVAALRRK